ncbi:hypothetical protein LRAMOSA04539 [Lichtheimia ramosa]|uniref:Uncharacterized protein n=1 Tax=Lichtheimia ramosa TaxID=688394 RepID=A0A077WYQ0_9FUNG|nr:hypothetical protein LRAMOSA04539 [Lichtheimia ramosa]
MFIAASHHSRHQSYWSWDSNQASTNLYTKPNVIQCTPTVGIPGTDILRLTLTLDDMAILPLLSIAFGSCVTPTTSNMIDTTTIELSAIVPEKVHIEDAVDRMPVPVHVVICSAQQQAQVLDNWLVATMTYSCDIQKQLRTENDNDGDDRHVGDDYKGKQPAVGRHDTSSASSRCCFFTVLPIKGIYIL